MSPFSRFRSRMVPSLPNCKSRTATRGRHAPCTSRLGDEHSLQIWPALNAQGLRDTVLLAEAVGPNQARRAERTLRLRDTVLAVASHSGARGRRAASAGRFRAVLAWSHLSLQLRIANGALRFGRVVFGAPVALGTE